MVNNDIFTCIFHSDRFGMPFNSQIRSMNLNVMKNICIFVSKYIDI